MKLDDIDIAHHTSNHVLEYQDIKFHTILTVCDPSRESSPYLPGDAKRIHHPFPNSAKFTGTVSEMENRFDKVRYEIKAYCLGFLDSGYLLVT